MIETTFGLIAVRQCESILGQGSRDSKNQCSVPDYKDFGDLYPSSEAEIDEFRWDDLVGGCAEEGKIGLRESTMWLGSKGAHSALHFDSYGVNIVLQVAHLVAPRHFKK